MKTIILLLVTILCGTSVYGQFGPQQIISTEAYGFPKLITADMDGDGDMDILMAGAIAISWFENTDGLGLYGNKQIIAETPSEFANTVSAADLDGDGDLDVLSAFSGEWPGISKLAWNENIDGQGNFGPQIILNDNNITSLTTALGVDIDNDSDIDVLTIERNSGRIAWYENLDGFGNFGPSHTISMALDWPIHGVVADIDNDGDTDIVSHAYDGNKIVWFENLDGLGGFSNHWTISTDVIRPIRVFCADIDSDGDMDVVSTSLDDNKIAWYENVDGQGTFGPQLIITQDVINPRNLYVQDLDGDGDQDILTSYWDNGNSGLVWLENLDGAGNFTSPLLISDEVDFVSSVYVSDLDQDLVFDILSASQFDHKIAWYENLGILNVTEYSLKKMVLYPNPTNGLIIINSEATISKIEVYNVIGQIINVARNTKEIDLSNSDSGIYFLKIEDENGYSEVHKVVKH